MGAPSGTREAKLQQVERRIMSRTWGSHMAMIPAAVGVVCLVCLPSLAQPQKVNPAAGQADPLVKLDLPERLDVQTYTATGGSRFGIRAFDHEER